MVGHEKSTHTPERPDRDEDTIARLAAGDADGLRHLLEDHSGIVRSRLRSSFGKAIDDSELDEVMSLTSIRVWHAAHRFDARLGTLRAWVSVIARNCALRLLESRRRGARIEMHADLDHLLPALPLAPPASSERPRLIADMLRCLQDLPPLQRAVLLADLEAGGTAPAEELAERLHTSSNSVYVSRLKGRRALRRALEHLGHAPGKDETDDHQDPHLGAELG